MTRGEFHKLFKSPGPVVTPVIHVLDPARTRRNLCEVVSAGAALRLMLRRAFEVCSAPRLPLAVILVSI